MKIKILFFLLLIIYSTVYCSVPSLKEQYITDRANTFKEIFKHADMVAKFIRNKKACLAGSQATFYLDKNANLAFKFDSNGRDAGIAQFYDAEMFLERVESMAALETIKNLHDENEKLRAELKEKEKTDGSK